MEDLGAPRRTHLAAERTWLAWWRTGITASAAAIGVGRVVPELVDGSTWPYVVLGAAYGAIGLALIWAAAIRQARVRAALARNEFDELSDAWVIAFTAAGIALTGFTVVLVLVG